jgi:hypothetical protein
LGSSRLKVWIKLSAGPPAFGAEISTLLLVEAKMLCKVGVAELVNK